MIIDTVLLLATEAKEAAAEGFGINTDILGTNLFNLSILLGLIIFYGAKFSDKSSENVSRRLRKL